MLIVVILETIEVNFHLSTPYHLVNLQQWPLYSLILSLHSVSIIKILLFHENYLNYSCKYVWFMYTVSHYIFMCC